MKLAVNQETLMKTPMEIFLEAIAKAGFTGVELRRDETFDYLKNHTAGIILLSNSIKILKKLGPHFSQKYYLLLPYHAIIDNTFPAVAANEIFYVTKKEKPLFKLMCAIKDNPYIHKPGTPNHLLNSERFKRLFTEYPTAIRNNLELTEMCDYVPENKGWVFPESNQNLLCCKTL